LREGRPSIAEIAFRLGFSETSAFQRFFRSATGTTPGALRKG
jgi:AraC-like DNA-binding protein